MAIGKFIKDTIKSLDLLGAPVGFRNKGDSTYSSVIVGIISIILLLLFITIFAFKLQTLLSLQSISASIASKNNQDDTQPIEDVFFAILPLGLNSSQLAKYFSFYITVGDKTVSLVQCTKELWNSKGIYNEIYYNGYWCPAQTEFLKIYIKSQGITFRAKCQRQCQQFWKTYPRQKFFQIYFQILNTLISDSQQNPLTLFVQCLRLPLISQTQGAITQVYLTPFQVNTDTNFLPFPSKEVKKGYFIQKYNSIKFLKSQFGRYYDGDMIVQIFNSKIKKVVSRTYGKFDILLSEIGGLFSLVFVAFAFFLSSYNEKKYQVMVGQTIFKNQSLDLTKKITEKRWNFLIYLKHTIYEWLAFFNCQPKQWKEMKQFNQNRTQALYLLDAKFLIMRIRYLQTAINILLPQNKRTCLRLIDVAQIQQIRKERKTMEIIDNYKIQKDKKDQQRTEKTNKDLTSKQMIENTIFHYSSPSQNFLKAKSNQNLQRFKQELSDSEYLEDENVKNQIQMALKQMLDYKQVDNQYNRIYDLMQDDFKKCSSWIKQYQALLRRIESEIIDSIKSGLVRVGPGKRDQYVRKSTKSWLKKKMLKSEQGDMRRRQLLNEYIYYSSIQWKAQPASLNYFNTSD